MKSFAYALLRGRMVNAAMDAEDVVQEALCRALQAQKRDKYDDTRNYASYIRGIALHVAQEHARRSRREQRSLSRLYWSSAEDAAHSENSGEAAADPRIAKLLRSWIQGLSPTLTSIWRARFVARLSQREAAA